MAIDTIWLVSKHEREEQRADSIESCNFFRAEDRMSGLFFDHPWDPQQLSGIRFKEGSFQLLDSPFFDFKHTADKSSTALVF
jgi:hypothetical protein